MYVCIYVYIYVHVYITYIHSMYIELPIGEWRDDEALFATQVFEAVVKIDKRHIFIYTYICVYTYICIYIYKFAYIYVCI